MNDLLAMLMTKLLRVDDATTVASIHLEPMIVLCFLTVICYDLV